MNTVWVLVIKHGHGWDDVADIVVFNSHAAALAGLYRYVVYWWGQVVGEEVPRPNKVAEAIAQYFTLALPSGEDYTLVERPING